MSEVVHGARARRLFGSAGILVGGQLLGKLASLLAFYLLAGRVESKTYGLYFYALSIGSAWSVLANFQLKAPLLRELTRDDHDSRTVIGQVLAFRLLVGLLVASLAGSWGWLHFTSPRERWIFELLLAANLLIALAATFEEALHAREAFRPAALATLLQGLTVSGGIILGVVVGRPVAWAVGSQVAGALLLCGLTWSMARRLYGHRMLRLAWDPTLLRSMVRLALGVAVGAQIGAWYGRIDLIFVERWLTESQLGQYSVPLRALDVAMGAAMTLGVAMLPMLARAQAAGLDALVPRLTTVLRFGLLLFLPAAGLVSMLAPELIGLFPAEYAAGDQALRLLIWILPAVFCETMLHWVLFFCDRGWQPALTLALALGVNAAGCAWLVPRYELAGAATARLAAELSIVALSAVLVHRLVPLRWLGLVGKPLTMTCAMAAAWAACPGQAVVRALVGLAAYAVAGLMLRPLEAREWALVKGLVGRGDVTAPA